METTQSKRLRVLRRDEELKSKTAFHFFSMTPKSMTQSIEVMNLGRIRLYGS